MRKGKGKGYDDYYDDEEYDYYDYYEDDYCVEKKPKQNKKKNQNTKPVQKAPQPQKKQIDNPTQQKKPETQTQFTTNKKDLRSLSIEELNKIKYPKIDYRVLSNIEDKKKNLNIVIIGHVDCGKSTLMGHLLYDLGQVDIKTLQKSQKYFKKTGTTQFHYAWATDESTDERERGVTVDIAYKSFKTKTKNITAMDAPGHRDFIPNMINGTSAADAALLVVDSGKNAFDAGFFHGGQTREHAILAKTLGVNQIIVCVNKLELYNWKKERFDYIEAQVRPFLINIGFDEKKIVFIPLSGLTGDNLIERTKEKACAWYTGQTLMEAMDNLDAPLRDVESPVRFVINDFIFSSVNNLQGWTIFGKLESGVINQDKEYEVCPLKLKIKIRTIVVNKEKVDYIIAGQTAELLLTLDKNANEDIHQGMILSSLEYQVPIVKNVKAQIKTLELTVPISLGQKMFMHLQSQKIQVKIKKINKIYNDDNTTVKNNSIFIPKNFNAIVDIESDEQICAELYSNIKQLGRITLRAEGTTIAVGFILEFI